jgi:hypothetical protein
MELASSCKKQPFPFGQAAAFQRSGMASALTSGLLVGTLAQPEAGGAPR